MSRKQMKKNTSKEQRNGKTIQKIRTILKFDKLKDILSDKLLAGYALPITRNVELKLVNLKNRLDSAGS